MNKLGPLLCIAGLGMLVACSNSGPKSSNDTDVLQARIDSLQQRLDDAYKPGLGEFMSGIQVHHAKLWFAGSAGNWKLADFEIGEIRETLDGAQNPAAFKTAFVLLTNTCNNCHRATKHEFNVIKIPDTPPITNQVFTK